MADLLLNIRFMERHLDNPFNFCRAEAYAGTGLEAKLTAKNRLLGYFGFDYPVKIQNANYSIKSLIMRSSTAISVTMDSITSTWTWISTSNC